MNQSVFRNSLLAQMRLPPPLTILRQNFDRIEHRLSVDLRHASPLPVARIKVGLQFVVAVSAWCPLSSA